jgi:hypothetical protein
MLEGKGKSLFFWVDELSAKGLTRISCGCSTKLQSASGCVADPVPHMICVQSNAKVGQNAVSLGAGESVRAPTSRQQWCIDCPAGSFDGFRHTRIVDNAERLIAHMHPMLSAAKKLSATRHIN